MENVQSCNVAESFKTFLNPGPEAGDFPKFTQFFFIIRYILWYNSHEDPIIILLHTFLYYVELLTERKTNKCRVKHDLLGGGNNNRQVPGSACRGTMTVNVFQDSIESFLSRVPLHLRRSVCFESFRCFGRQKNV